MKLAGVKLDVYDDPDGEVLRRLFPQPDMLPETVKMGSPLPPEVRDTLPDDVFGLVIHDEGYTLRKYAMVDPANTALSVIYFLESRNRFPEEACKVAAARLVAGCYEYGIQPPAVLMAEAQEKLADLYPSSSLRQLTETRNKKGEVVDSSKPYPDNFPNPELRSQAEQLQAQDDQIETQRDELQLQSDTVRLQGKRLEMQQVRELQAQAQAPQAAAVPPQVETTGQEPPPQPVQMKQAAVGDCLLVINGEGRYPVRTYGDVEKASSYFHQYWGDFTLPQRREFCTKLAAKADEFGYLELPELIEKYASTQIDPMSEMYFAVRIDAVQSDLEAVRMYDSLCKMACTLDPDVAASALYDLDRATGLDTYYDHGIPDPYLTLFGHTKTADVDVEDMWTWQNEIGDSTNEEQLQNLVGDTNHRCTFERQFDEDFVSSFAKDPITIFESLPDHTKAVIARLSSPHAGQ